MRLVKWEEGEGLSHPSAQDGAEKAWESRRLMWECRGAAERCQEGAEWDSRGWGRAGGQRAALFGPLLSPIWTLSPCHS